VDKNSIKKYAVWARKELISRVSQRAALYGITEQDPGDSNAESVNGHVLSKTEQAQRKALIDRIYAKGYEQAMEEAAYTWFNRFCALRFMEVNNYLPSRVRVFTDEENAFKPQILSQAIDLEIDGLDLEKVYALKTANETDALFKYLVITQCNALSRVLPGMFQPIADYTELLFPDNLLREGSAVEQMVAMIPQEDWKDAVQILGWLYQYYNSEKKDEVFAALKKNVKITKENIPAATQLFTPDWIVRYMVENSLGRLWLEGHPNDELKAKWKYYLDEAEQEPQVQAQLAEIRKGYAVLTPEQIKCVDPCAGSGHILAYMFDVLMQIYLAYGCTVRESVAGIVEHNLYGLDIDNRAAQLAYFAVMMKARQYDRRFLTRKDENGGYDVPQAHVYAIQESGRIRYRGRFCDYLLEEKHRETLRYLLEVFQDAKEYGSILRVEQRDYPGFLDAWKWCEEATRENMDMLEWYNQANQVVPALARQAIALSQKYDVVVTNPPYMSGSGMGTKLAKFVKENYPDSKSDMSTVCMEKTLAMCNENGYMAVINIPVWMFLSSFEKMRKTMLANNTITSMVHPGRGIFGSDFGTTSFVFAKRHIADYKGAYCRLFELQGEVKSVEERERAFHSGRGRFNAQQSNFSKIPGSPVAYWVSSTVYRSFILGKPLSQYANLKQGMSTANNDLFLRLWFEVNNQKISFNSQTPQQAIDSKMKWFPHTKGGEARKWYGNNEYLVNWYNDGEEIKKYPGSAPRSSQYYFREGLTWSTLTASFVSFRYTPTGYTMNTKGSICYLKNSDNLKYILGLLNCKVAMCFLILLAPTLDYSQGPVGKLPIIYSKSAENQIAKLVEKNIKLSQYDWDSFETSWDFQRHPLVRPVSTVAAAYTAWETECEQRFQTLKSNEEELNRIFINIYGLQDELTPEVEDKNVTVRKADLGRDIRSLISYAVGCMFGRYSLYKDGIIFAGETYSLNAWVEKMNDKPGVVSESEIQRAYCNEGIILDEMFCPDKHAILPICDDEYFENDIVNRFVEFLRVVFGEETLTENLRFIADALGGGGRPKEVIRNYFLNGFYADHLKIYQKRPIYWLFDSGKKNGFKCLIYLHRYKSDTVARVRTDYVHEQQSRYRTAIADLKNRVEDASGGERVRLSKKLKTMQEQSEEVRKFEEKVHHLADRMISIDLDDGVKHNYAIFQDVLAKIK